ncbi:hypothetical protein E3N88_00597 [Mikania micrantha]|uniref:BED-type domain-containing protein n=1 Tax=Mikania micrantha TaxID=192012 RepID=A0A5N6Q0G5_9ASTR|nr:hypothetical protein E3N88_00597 [Mikania micrantha]
MATIPIYNDSQEEDETFVDETPPNNVESSNVEEQTQQIRNRKQANNNEGAQSKVQRVGKHKAKCWESFTVVYLEEEDGVTRKNGLCKFCKHYIKDDPNINGTNGLKKHADDDWVMHKRNINSRPIHSHKGDAIAHDLLDCIHGWGIKNVMTLTVDNASSNDKAIDYLVKKFPNLCANGKHFQVRCMAHILNLIVKEGLKENNLHVDCLRKAIKHIRSSTQRITTFKKCMEKKKVGSNRFLCGDCPTRWNSVYEMLKVAVDLKEVFFAYEREDRSYFLELDRVPEKIDFDMCKKLIEFLEKFKIKTDIASSTSKPLAHIFLERS